jgi:hypothetical protein
MVWDTVARVHATSSSLASMVGLAIALAAGLPDARAAAQSPPGGALPMSPIPAGETRDAQARFGALRASPSADVEIVEESVSLRCVEEGELAACELEARWILRASREQRVQLYASVVGADDGRLRAEGASTDAPSVVPLAVTLVANVPQDVVLTARARLRPASSSSDALDARHLVLGTPREGPRANLLFTRAVAHTFASTPEALGVEVSFTGVRPFTARALDLALDAGRVTLVGAQLGGRANVPLRLQREGGFALRHGGPFVGLGGTIDRGFRGRLGYELGLGELVVVSVAIDSDFSDSVAVAALVELATPSFVIPPSLAAGVGFVQRFRLGALPSGSPAASSGLRLEASAVLAVLGVVASFDYFPDDGGFTVSLLGRVSI